MARAPIGVAIIATGILLVLVDLLVWRGALSWFGRLPGDLRIERPTVRIHFPIVSMLVLPLGVSLNWPSRDGSGKGPLRCA